ncbi:MAG: hypothetical protein PHF56_23195 [Desulfuromonadaceae bacterium]|nr:hypothetical protein [Desulfuromonadaceae bacterium]
MVKPVGIPNGARFTEKFTHVIDSEGNKVALDDPRVWHIWTLDAGLYTQLILKNRFARRGWQFRLAPKNSKETMQLAMSLGSGRECVPCVGIIGATCKDMLENRSHKDEISIYYNIDQDGPCQNGGFPVIWSAIAQRVPMDNVVFLTWPSQRNNYINRGEAMAADVVISIIFGDLLDEAESSLKVLAKDKKSALDVFEKETHIFMESCKEGKQRGNFYDAANLLVIEKAWRRWTKNVSKIPLKSTVEETPRVLLFSGGNLLWINYPVTDYFIEQGVIPKQVDLSEFFGWLESEDIVRYGFARGYTEAIGQYNFIRLAASFLNPGNWKNREMGLRALRCRWHLWLLDFLITRWRKMGTASGLLFDKQISWNEVTFAGNKHSSDAGYHETCANVGRYVLSAQGDVFDAVVNVSSFNCAPAMNTAAIVRHLASSNDMPYAAIDMEGPWISASQMTLLETIAVQARRSRNKKNQGKRSEPVGEAGSLLSPLTT